MRVPRNAKQYEPAPPGTYAAQLIGIVQLGTQDGNYGQSNLARLTFVLPFTKMANGKPYVVSKTYAMSTFRKAGFAKAVNALAGRTITDDDYDAGFSLSELLTRTCTIAVSQKPTTDGDGVRATIDAVTPPMAGLQWPPLDAQPTFFSLQEDEFDRAAYDDLADWIKEIIAKSPEFQALTSPKPKSASGNGSPSTAAPKAPRPQREPKVKRAPKAAPPPPTASDDLDDEIPY